MSYLAAEAADVTIVSDGSESESDQELFNMASINEKASLLTGQRDHEQLKRRSPGSQPKSKVSYGDGYKGDLPRNSGHLKPETMDEELNGHYSKESSALLPLPADMKLSEARMEKRKEIMRKVSLACFIGLLMWIALPLNLPTHAVLNITETRSQVIVLGCLYSSVILSSLMGPSVVKSMTIRWAVVAGCIGISIFTITKFDGRLYFVLPGVIIAGLCLGPALCALWTYIVCLARDFAMFDDSKPEKTLLVFSGLFHSWLCGALFFAELLVMVTLPFQWGSGDTHSPNSRELEASTLLPDLSYNISTTIDTTNISTDFTSISTTSTVRAANHSTFHSTAPTTAPRSSPCGPEYCWPHFLDSVLPVVHHDVSHDFRMQALLGCLLVCSLGGLLLAWLGIEKTSHAAVESDEEYSCRGGGTQHLAAVFSLMRQSEMLLLIPASVFIGLQQLLGYSVYVQAFVSCDLGGRLAPYVILVMSGSPLLLSSPTGLLAGYTGRMKVLLPVAVLHACLIIVYLAWPGDPWSTAVYFVLAALWGLADAGWQLVLMALLGQLFPSDLESAMANYHLWKTVGFTLVYTCQAVGLCSRFQLGFSLLILTISALTYVALEIRVRLREQEARASCQEDHNLVMPALEEASWLPNINPMQVRKERTSALLNRVPNVVDPDLVST